MLSSVTSFSVESLTKLLSLLSPLFCILNVRIVALHGSLASYVILAALSSIFQVQTNVPSLVALHVSSLAGLTSQFVNGTHEFSELVLVRMALLIDRSSSVLPLRSVNARELIWRVVAGKMYARALELYILTCQNQFFLAGQTGEMQNDLSVNQRPALNMFLHLLYRFLVSIFSQKACSYKTECIGTKWYNNKLIYLYKIFLTKAGWNITKVLSEASYSVFLCQ